MKKIGWPGAPRRHALFYGTALRLAAPAVRIKRSLATFAGIPARKRTNGSFRESPPQGVTIVAAFLLIQVEIPALCVARHFNAGMRFTE